MDKFINSTNTLQAFCSAVAPRSGYILDRLRELHKAKAKNWPEPTKPPSDRQVLKELRKMERDGLIKCVGGGVGIYGYEWKLTSAGFAKAREEGFEISPRMKMV